MILESSNNLRDLHVCVGCIPYSVSVFWVFDDLPTALYDHVDIATRHHDTPPLLYTLSSVLSGARPMLMATPVASLSEPVWMGHLPHPG